MKALSVCFVIVASMVAAVTASAAEPIPSVQSGDQQAPVVPERDPGSLAQGEYLRNNSPKPFAEDDSTPIVRPKLMKYFVPSYPSRALQNEIEGNVVVRFQISPEGTVFNATVHTATDPVFEMAALSAVRRCRYASAPEGGNTYGGRWFYLRYRFVLEADAGVPPPNVVPSVQSQSTP